MGKNKDMDNIQNASNENLNPDIDTTVQGNSISSNCEGNLKSEKSNTENSNGSNSEVKELHQKLEQKTNEVQEYVELLQRTLAEFDNYKKRTAKEKEMLYNDAVVDIISNVLPIIDTMEKAVKSCSETESKENIVQGVEMILKQFKDMLKTYDVYEIEAIGESFNPEYHEAVMHVQDENFGENEITEELRKGYRCKDRIVRHSMVKVAN